MERPITIFNMANSMREFQKKNSITKQCITNVQFLSDCIKRNTNENIFVKAVFVLSTDCGVFKCVSGHLVIIIDNQIIDPSHDVYSRNDRKYFDNVKDMIDNCDDGFKPHAKDLISDFLAFMKYADQINNGELLVPDKLFYNQQADYIESLYCK